MTSRGTIVTGRAIAPVDSAHTHERLLYMGATELDSPAGRAGRAFAGRTQELDELRAVLREAIAGHGRLVLVAGEPGTMLMPVAAVISEERLRTPQFLSLLPSNIEYRWNAGALLTPGVEILRYRPASERDSVAGVWLGIGLRATFGGPSTGLRELREMRAHCVGIVESFAPEFP